VFMSQERNMTPPWRIGGLVVAVPMSESQLLCN
jgi:hypothetical protein